ncbi:periplasmic heavy metal sensor [Desulfomicrobium escambiense]|uniref:periplasmic heavy metal sensor n=1 Tax=Desulfomicrobium escambiense TaxID=29503 RepID=UPI0004090EC6|nr:periplasmic heavy metal sensor [Desulfomicrobium escambiense]
MKTNRNVIATFLTLAFITAFAGFASAQGHGMMGGMGAMTPEHQATMQKLHADFNTATADLHKQLFAKESELNAALYADKPDEKKIDALTKEIGELNAKIYTERVKMHRAMAKEGIVPGAGGCQMMGGKMGGGMMGGGMMGGGMMGGMQHNMTGNGTTGQMPAGHAGHGTPAQQ